MIQPTEPDGKRYSAIPKSGGVDAMPLWIDHVHEMFEASFERPNWWILEKGISNRVLSYMVCAGRPVSFEELQIVFPKHSKGHLSSVLVRHLRAGYVRHSKAYGYWETTN